MRIGLLNAGEMLSYNVAQMTIIYFISQVGLYRSRLMPMA